MTDAYLGTWHNRARFAALGVHGPENVQSEMLDCDPSRAVGRLQGHSQDRRGLCHCRHPIGDSAKNNPARLQRPRLQAPKQSEGPRTAGISSPPFVHIRGELVQRWQFGHGQTFSRARTRSLMAGCACLYVHGLTVGCWSCQCWTRRGTREGTRGTKSRRERPQVGTSHHCTYIPRC